MSARWGMADDPSLKPDAVLDMTQMSAAQGAMCALLTPAIKSELQQMSGGQILEIRVNDPTAREDIASWSRLSGHELLAEIEETPQVLRVFLRKKQG